MQKRPQLIVPAVALGVIFLVIAAIYWIDDAGSLPSFFPGHEAGSTHVHFKHGLAAAIVGARLLRLRLVSDRGPAPEGRPRRALDRLTGAASSKA